MFEKIIGYVRGVFDRMFGYTQLRNLAGRDITMSQEMIDAIDSWNAMLTGKAPWVDNESVVSLKIEQGICREFADVVLNEMESKVSHEGLNNIYQRAIRDVNENLQEGLALGSFIIKPLAGGAAEFVSADKFIPVQFNSSGKVSDCIFLSVKRVGQNEYYTRAEHHYLQNGALTIENQCYHSQSRNDLGQLCSLSEVEEWERLEPGPVSYPGMEQMDFGYFRVPLKNRIDGSPCGVSVFAPAAELIQKADIQYGRLDWEYDSGERAVHVDERALKKENGRASLPKMKKRLYRGLNIDPGNGELYKEYSPEIRDEAYIRGLEKLYRQIEFVVGLSYGDLSDVNEVEKTVAEIRASKQRKYNRVTAIQENLKECLMDFAAALAFYNGLYTSGYEFSCRFNDSILTDEEAERQQDRQDVAMGAMTVLDYRMKWYQEDEAEARKHIVSEDVPPDPDEE